MSLEMNSTHFESSLMIKHMNVHLRTGLGVLHSLLTIFVVLVLHVRTTQEGSVHRTQCEVLSYFVKPRPHLVKCNAASVLHNTKSSPNHAMSSLIQTELSTTHTTTSSPRRLRSLRTNVDFHTYLYCLKAHFHAASSIAHAASVPHHCRVKPHPACQHFVTVSVA
ncbi:hypothetical protein F4604DRAFT_63136 [Suillus subluteus]|nr:hypothetical protein F4604DRAFT_63136 [Suillus subluteus]